MEIIQSMSWGYIVGMIFLLFMIYMFFADGQTSVGFFLLLIAVYVTYNHFQPESIADRQKSRDKKAEQQAVVSKIEAYARNAFTNPPEEGIDKLTGKILIVIGNNGKVTNLDPSQFRDMPSEIKTNDFYTASYIAWIRPEYRKVGTYREKGFSCSHRNANIITYHAQVININRKVVTFSRSFTGPDPPKVMIEGSLVSTLPEGGYPPDDDVKDWLKTLHSSLRDK